MGVAAHQRRSKGTLRPGLIRIPVQTSGKEDDRALRSPTRHTSNTKWPLTRDMVAHLAARALTTCSPERLHVLCLIIFATFFGLRPSEYLFASLESASQYILRRKHLTFLTRKYRPAPLQDAEFVVVHIPGSKTDPCTTEST